MNTISQKTSCPLVTFCILLSISILHTQDVEPPFDVNQTIEQVYECRNFTEPREGEFLIDTNVVYVEAIGFKYLTAIAFDGTNYLVVWVDTRRKESYDICGARVTPSGTVLDSAGILICTAVRKQDFPAVTFGSTHYLVVRHDWRNDYGNYDNSDIYGARVTQSGIVLDTAGIAIADSTYKESCPSVGFDGTNYMVVWHDYRNDNYYPDIYGARVDTSGVVLDIEGFVVSDAPNSQAAPSIAFDGTNYLTVWCNSGNIFGARVEPSGTVIDSSGIPISIAPGNQYRPHVTFGGTYYLVVWHDGRNCVWACDIYGARVTPSGIVLDPEGIIISPEENHQLYPSVAFDGINYLVTWYDNREGGSSVEIYGARVDTAGFILDPLGILISQSQDASLRPAVAFDGVNYFVVWDYYESGGSNTNVYGTRVSQLGYILDSLGILISTAAYGQFDPSVAFDGTNYLAIWEDTREDPYSDIYGTRISPTGAILEPNSIPICTAENEHVDPSVIFGGTHYLAVWEDKRSGEKDIYGTRILPSGAVLDTSGIPVSVAPYEQRYPTIAFDGTNYFVVWQDYRCGYQYDIYGARVSSSGVVLDTAGIMIDTTALSPHRPAVGFDGTNYLVVWSAYPGVGPPRDLYGIRISQSGEVLDPAPLIITNAAGHQKLPHVGFDGTNYLVVWEDWRYYQDSADVWGARVDTSGTVLDPNGFVITDANRHQGAPVVTFDGLNYVVVWEDKRSGFYYDIYGAKVDTSGLVLDSFAVSTQNANQFTPSLTSGEADQILFVYSSWTSSINNHPANTFRIWGKFYPFVGIEENARRSTLYALRLLEVYPNPVQKECNIEYNLPQKSKVNISLFDVTGRLVQEIINEKQNTGKYSRTFDMTDLSQGVYFIKFNTEKCSETKKIIFIK